MHPANVLSLVRSSGGKGRKRTAVLNEKGESELDGTLGPQSVLSTFIEFFGIALGPQYEMALYELNDDNTGTAVQVEFSLVTDVEKEDPLPEDVVSFLNQS